MIKQCCYRKDKIILLLMILKQVIKKRKRMRNVNGKFKPLLKSYSTKSMEDVEPIWFSSSFSTVALQSTSIMEPLLFVQRKLRKNCQQITLALEHLVLLYTLESQLGVYLHRMSFHILVQKRMFWHFSCSSMQCAYTHLHLHQV